MKNKKKLKITLISLLILVSVIIIGGTAGFYYLGDYVISALFKSMMVEQLTTQLGVDNLDEALTPELLQSLEGLGLQTEQDALSEGSTDSKGAEQKDDQAKGQQTEGQKKETTHKPTKKEIQKAIDKKVDTIVKAIPNGDKKEMMDLVTNNISKQDMERLVSLLADGLTKEDMAEAKQIALKSFTPEQLEQVKTYYQEYSGVVLQ